MPKTALVVSVCSKCLIRGKMMHVDGYGMFDMKNDEEYDEEESEE